MIRGNLFAILRTLREIILSDEKVFIPLSIEIETKLKKEETANKKTLIQTKLNFNDIK